MEAKIPQNWVPIMTSSKCHVAKSSDRKIEANGRCNDITPALLYDICIYKDHDCHRNRGKLMVCAKCSRNQNVLINLGSLLG